MKKWDTLLTAGLVVCAAMTTSIVVYRQFFAPTAASANSPRQDPVFVDDWKSHLAKATRLGRIDAPVQLIEYADFECPACGDFHKTLADLRERYPTQVALAFIHYPLPMHRFAEPAARVAECAGKQQRFEEMHDLLFEQQNQLGLKPWKEFATEAGVSDLAAFESCAQSKDPIPAVIEGRRLGDEIDVQGTPTLVINGWKLGSPPSAKELDAMVQAILAGKSPVATGNKTT
jgi:protein-disulfide isomerase